MIPVILFDKLNGNIGHKFRECLTARGRGQCMNMVNHKTQSIDNHSITTRHHGKNRIIYQIIFHFIENVESRNCSLVSVIHLLFDKLPFHNQTVALKYLAFNTLDNNYPHFFGGQHLANILSTRALDATVPFYGLWYHATGVQSSGVEN